MWENGTQNMSYETSYLKLKYQLKKYFQKYRLTTAKEILG